MRSAIRFRKALSRGLGRFDFDSHPKCAPSYSPLTASCSQQEGATTAFDSGTQQQGSYSDFFSPMGFRASSVWPSPAGRQDVGFQRRGPCTGSMGRCHWQEIPNSLEERLVEPGPLCFSDDGKLLAVVDGKTMRVWETADWTERTPPPDGRKVVLNSFVGKRMYVGDERGKDYLWDLASLEKQVVPTGGRTGLLDCSYRQMGKRLAASGSGATAARRCCADVATGKVPAPTCAAAKTNDASVTWGLFSRRTENSLAVGRPGDSKCAALISRLERKRRDLAISKGGLRQPTGLFSGRQAAGHCILGMAFGSGKSTRARNFSRRVRYRMACRRSRFRRTGSSSSSAMENTCACTKRRPASRCGAARRRKAKQRPANRLCSGWQDLRCRQHRTPPLPRRANRKRESLLGEGIRGQE